MIGQRSCFCTGLSLITPFWTHASTFPRKVNKALCLYHNSADFRAASNLGCRAMNELYFLVESHDEQPRDGCCLSQVGIGLSSATNVDYLFSSKVEKTLRHSVHLRVIVFGN